MDENRIEIHRGRQRAYLVLAKAFLLQPNAEILDDLSRVDFCNISSTHSSPDLEIGSAKLREVIRDMPSTLADLELDYAQLFVGPSEVLAPPWESIYRTEEHLVFGQSTLDVRAFFARHGLAIPKMNREPDDHFGLELAFMSVLAERTADAYERNNYIQDAINILREQQSFIREHLGEWTDKFTESVRQSAKTSFFRGLSVVASSFIRQDTAWLFKFAVCPVNSQIATFSKPIQDQQSL